MSTLRVAEVFASIQGEGIWAGIPSAFVRVSGCNLRCSWCDTPYASWRPEGPVRAVEDIVTEIVGLKMRHVVLTGGEPMLFPSTVLLARELADRGHVITVETAGTVFQDLPCDLMSVSPKLGNSTPAGAEANRHETIRTELSPLIKLTARYDCQLKFVVQTSTAEADVAEIEGLVEAIGWARPDRVLLMPEGTTRQAVRDGLPILAPFALARGWRLCPRLHIELYGDTRGT
ncbi:MAG: 7-carboxy-7-deazaguanine synthase QueE [Fimbriimonadaceae bacterium]|nr:7-carboxy-7-deazaguanine synthase QueE [Fimbriimonadaceae bacterium]